MLDQRCFVVGIDIESTDVFICVSFSNFSRGARLSVAELDMIVTGFREQSANKCANLASAEYENVLHEISPAKENRQRNGGDMARIVPLSGAAFHTALSC
jgi:hypothetical protein